MNEIPFYRQLEKSQVDTTEIDGKLLCYENSGIWHLCRNRAMGVRYACGSSAPINPTDGDYWRNLFEKYAEVLTPRQLLEKTAACSSCESRVKEEYNLVRVVAAVTPYDEITDESPELDHFAELWQEETDG